MDCDSLYWEFLTAVKEDNLEKVKRMEKTFFAKKHDINLLSHCAEHNSFNCLKHLCESEEYSMHSFINSYHDKTPLEYACINDNIYMVRYLTSRYPGKHDAVTLKKAINASLDGKLDVTQHLLNELKYRNIRE